MQQIYIFRHGVTEWNLHHLVQGFSDIPLHGRGREQAKVLQTKLQGRVKYCISSDLMRAKETAQIACPQIHIDYFSDLREACLGEAEGLTLSAVEEQFGELFWDISRYEESDFWDFRYPQGESRQEVVTRFRQRVFDFYPFDNLAISAHGGILRLFILSEIIRCGLDIAEIPIPNCALYRLDYRDQLCTSYQLC